MQPFHSWVLKGHNFARRGTGRRDQLIRSSTQTSTVNSKQFWEHRSAVMFVSHAMGPWQEKTAGAWPVDTCAAATLASVSTVTLHKHPAAAQNYAPAQTSVCVSQKPSTNQGTILPAVVLLACPSPACTMVPVKHAGNLVHASPGTNLTLLFGDASCAGAGATKVCDYARVHPAPHRTAQPTQSVRMCTLPR